MHDRQQRRTPVVIFALPFSHVAPRCMSEQATTLPLTQNYCKVCHRVMPEKRPPLPLLLTAQDLRGGGVIYWDGDGWSARVEDAAVAQDERAAAALETARDAALRTADVVDAFLTGVDADANPRHFRERARVFGPTFRDDFGRNGGARRVSL